MTCIRHSLLAVLVPLLAVCPTLADDTKVPLPELPPVFSKANPTTVEDLEAIQDQVVKVVDRVMPAVVSVRIGAASGSGVIINKEGHILTAGHVSGKPGREVAVIFHDGKKVKGITMGGNHGIDSGMIKITTPGEYPFMEMGDSSSLAVGQWCIVCSHPGGFRTGRTPPVRLGRVLRVSSTAIMTDCTLVGGDSGGPLFDMHGRVIGINSRISQAITANVHVPVNPYRDTFERMAKNEVWGGRTFGGVPAAPPAGPYLGVQFDTAEQGCIVQQVVAGSPAEKAGLMAKDEILKFAGKDVDSGQALSSLVRSMKAGAEVTLEVRRGEQILTLSAIIGKR